MMVSVVFSGVIAMSWCPNDSLYLVSCSKDNRTICWDTNSGEVSMLQQETYIELFTWLLVSYFITLDTLSGFYSDHQRITCWDQL